MHSSPRLLVSPQILHVFHCSSEIVEGLHLAWARLSSRLLGGRVESEALSESFDWLVCSPVEIRLNCIRLAQPATPVTLVYDFLVWHLWFTSGSASLMLDLLWHSRPRQLPWRCDCGQPHETRVLAAVRFVVERRIRNAKSTPRAASSLGGRSRIGFCPPTSTRVERPISSQTTRNSRCLARSFFPPLTEAWMSWMSWMSCPGCGLILSAEPVSSATPSGWSLGWPGTGGHPLHSLPLSCAAPDTARSMPSPAGLESCWLASSNGGQTSLLTPLRRLD